MYIERHMEKTVLEASKVYPVVMVCGQRQVGKSTMLSHIMEEDRKYVTLDDMNARRLAETDPGLFFETYGLPIFIDEFQRVPSLLIEIKKIVDDLALKGKPNEGVIWLSGSQKFQMMKNVSESLAGRVAVLELSSLTTAEIEKRPAELTEFNVDFLKSRISSVKSKNTHEIYSDIFRGGMPKAVTTKVDRERYYADYINTYIERDIKGLSQVGKLSEFYDFLVYLAARTSQQLNYNEISSAIGVSAPTIKEWVSILERSGVIYLLRPYANNISKRLVKTPKVYFMDTGLAAYLCRWPNAKVLEFGAMDGAFLETYVVTEIIKNYWNMGKMPNLYYYRDIDGKEIDLLVVDAVGITPIEIKKSKSPSNADKNFSALKKFKMDINTGFIVCMADEFLPYSRDVYYCPIGLL